MFQQYDAKHFLNFCLIKEIIRIDLVWEMVKYMAKKTIHAAFHVNIYLISYTYTLYILELDSSVPKSAEILTILYHFVPKIKKKH